MIQLKALLACVHNCAGPCAVQGLIAVLRQLGQELQQEVGATPDSFHSQALQGMLFKALVPLLDPEAITQQDLPQQQQQQLVQATSSRSSSSRQNAGNAELLRLLQLPDMYDPKVLPQGRQVLPAPPGLQDSQQHTALTQHQQQQQSDSSQQQQQQQQEEEQGLPGTAAMQARINPDPQSHLIRCHPRAPHSPSSASHCSTHTTATRSSTHLGMSGAAAGEVERAGGAGALPLHLPVEKDAVRLQASGEAEYTGDVAARMGERVLYLAGKAGFNNNTTRDLLSGFKHCSCGTETL